jgi:hypothetical protein
MVVPVIGMVTPVSAASNAVSAGRSTEVHRAISQFDIPSINPNEVRPPPE